MYQQMEWTPERIGRFWDWQSQFPETYFTYQFGDRIVRQLHRHLVGCQAVLDLGCGTGFLLPHLARVAKSVTGADVSPDSVARANEFTTQLPNVEGAFLVDELIKRDVRFDAVLVVEVVEHLPDDDLHQLLLTARQLTKEGGVAVFTTPNEEDLRASLIYCPQSDVTFHRWQHVRSWSASSLSEHVSRYGYEVSEAYATDFRLRPLLTPKGMMQRGLRWIAGGEAKPPHLVCVARAVG
jgi:2-polyprenyl-3-methyl-5-hydroxy-6-metoxy-1,4-benzoquinol methylase